VVVTNSLGSVASSVANLTVVNPADIGTQPESQTVLQGQDASFSVLAGGTGPLSYQWNFNGTALSGATDSALPLSSVQAANAGSYNVVVSNPWSSTTSAVATLTVVAPAQVDTPPVSQTVVQGRSTSLSVLAEGTGPLSYQWSFDGAPLSGATDSTL